MVAVFGVVGWTGLGLSHQASGHVRHGAAALTDHSDAEQVLTQGQPCLNQYYLLKNSQEFPG